MAAANLTELLEQEGSFTVFAPTDDAFADMTTDDMTLLKSPSVGRPAAFEAPPSRQRNFESKNCL